MRKPQDIQDLANFHILCHSWNNLRKTSIWQKLPIALLHKKWSFSLRISSINMTKSTVSCRFGHIYWRKTKWETSFFVNHILKKCHHLNFAYTLNLYEFDNACKEKTMIDSWSKSKLVSLVIWFFRCGRFHDKTDLQGHGSGMWIHLLWSHNFNLHFNFKKFFLLFYLLLNVLLAGHQTKSLSDSIQMQK